MHQGTSGAEHRLWAAGTLGRVGLDAPGGAAVTAAPRELEDRTPARFASGRAALSGGAVQIAVGVVVLGLSSYGFLALSARGLGATTYASLAVLWALALLVGPGAFYPLEQELARSIAARRAQGFGVRPVVVRTAEAGAALLALLSIAVLGSYRYLVGSLFDHDALLVVGLLCALVGSYTEHLVKGLLLGFGYYRRYAVVLSVEGLFRLGGACVLVASSTRSAGLYGVVVGLGPIAASVVGLSLRREAAEGGPRADRQEVFASVGVLLASSALNGVLVNLGPVLVKAFAAPSERAGASRFLATLVIARVPLFLFGAIEAAALPRFSSFAAVGDKASFVSSFKKLLGGVSALAAAGCLGAAAAGPFAVKVLYGQGFVLGRSHLVYLAAASGVFMMALTSNAGLITLNSQEKAAAGWLVGTMTFLGVATVGGSALVRVERALLCGTVGAFLTMTALVALEVRSWTAGTGRKVGSIVLPPPEP